VRGRAGRHCSTADDIAAQIRRNETRPLRLMPPFRVNSGTAANGMAKECLWALNDPFLISTTSPRLAYVGLLSNTLGALAARATRRPPQANADGSTTIYFGPSQPAGLKWGDWIQTISGKGWFTLLRLYSPLEPFFTKE
jgi:hypothetical protein